MQRFLTWTIAVLVGFLAFFAESREIDMRKQLTDAMQQGDKAYSAGQMAEAIKHFTSAANIAEIEKIYSKQCLALYNIGVCYFSLLDHGEALNYYRHALELCEKHHLSTIRKMEILHGISGVFFEMDDYAKAKEIVIQTYKLARSVKDTIMCEHSAFALALISNKERQFDLTERYLKEAASYGSITRSRSNVTRAEALYLQKKYPELKALCLSSIHKPTNFDGDKGLLYNYLIEIANAENDYKGASVYIDSCRRFTSASNRVQMFSCISETYEGLGDYPRALAYKDSAAAWSDSLARLNNRQLIANSNVKLEVMKFRLEKEKELSVMRQRTRVWIFIACTFLILLVVAAMMVWIQKQRSAHRSQIMQLRIEHEKEEKKLTEERMKETELIASYQQQIMRQELEKRNTELSATSMFVTKRNKLLQDLLKYLDKADGARNIPELRQLSSHITRMLSDSDDEKSFMKNFEAANPDFSQKLLARHPDLLQSDLRFLAYIRMNMTMKEIASFLNINPDSCKRRKIRLSKKLELDSSSDLYSYILSF